jgi:hypothetical protein
MQNSYSMLNLDSLAEPSEEVPISSPLLQPGLRCSFCGLGEGEVERLFEGRAGYICDECVEVCIQLLEDYRDLGLKTPSLKHPWYKRLFGAKHVTETTCNFNLHDRHNPPGERLFPGFEAKICEKCVRACEVLKSGLLLGE